jgi:hypothetical protein
LPYGKSYTFFKKGWKISKFLDENKNLICWYCDIIDYEISNKNNMKIKENQVKEKNTHYVKCKSCGADNLVSSKTQKCKYCRKHLK